MNRYARITPADAPAFDLDSALEYLRIDDSDRAAEVESFIAQATSYVENYTGRALLPQVWTLSRPDWPSLASPLQRAIPIGRTPLRSVASVKYWPDGGGEQATLDAANYLVITAGEPGCIYFRTTATLPDLDDRPDAVEITFTAGYYDAASVDPRLVAAIQLSIGASDVTRTAIITGTIVADNPMYTAVLDQARVGGWIA